MHRQLSYIPAVVVFVRQGRVEMWLTERRLRSSEIGLETASGQLLMCSLSISNHIITFQL